MTLAISRHLNLIAKLQVRNDLSLSIGEVLKELKGGTFKEEIGAGIDTWHQYLSQPEIGLTVQEAKHLIDMYELSNTYGDLSTIPARYWKLLKKEGITEEIINDAKTLSYQDLRDQLYDKETNNAGERTYTYMVMRRCNETGNLQKVPLVESQEVVEKFSDKIEFYG